MDLIYFDNAATTRVSDSVKAEMEIADKELYFNSAALYSPSLAVKKEIERAGKIVKQKLTRTGEGELVFTSGATESNNMIIFGKITHQRQHMLIAAGEHSSTYAPSIYLKNNGFEVDYLPLTSSGEIDLIALRRLVKPNTALLVFGMVNSDTGSIQNAAEIVKIVKGLNPKVHVHCDAVQAFCKFNFDVAIMGLDSCAVSSHKIYGPKGIGALWIKKGVTLRPIMYGGSQQDYRPGTENNTSILGFAKAVESFDTLAFYNKVDTLHKRLIKGLPENCKINGSNLNPYITNIGLPGVLGNTVMNALSAMGICVGLGSACAATASKNRTLLAMGIPEEKTKQVLRISFGVYNTEAEVDRFCSELKEILKSLRK